MQGEGDTNGQCQQVCHFPLCKFIFIHFTSVFQSFRILCYIYMLNSWHIKEHNARPTEMSWI